MRKIFSDYCPLIRPGKVGFTALVASIMFAAALSAFAAPAHLPPAASLKELEPQVEQSVARGLAWLARSQRDDGSFEDGSWGNNLTAVIALAGKAFLVYGVTPKHPQYGVNVERCADFLLAHQQPDGLFWCEGAHSFKGGAFMYSHALSTVFIAELSGMTDTHQQSRIDAALAKATALILSAQNEAGGWRYAPVPPVVADLSVSAWCLMALRISRLNGAAVPAEAIDRAMNYVRSHARADGFFGYSGAHDPAPAMTAAGIACLCLGGMADDPILPVSGRVLLAGFGTAGDLGMISMGATIPGMPEYRRYCGALAMHALGTQFWEIYRLRHYPNVMRGQAADGRWGSPYTTAINLLVLGLSLEQSPSYQR